MNMKTSKAPKISIILISCVPALIFFLCLPFDSHAQVGAMMVLATQYTANTNCCGGTHIQVAVPDKRVKKCNIHNKCSAAYPAGRLYSITFTDNFDCYYAISVGEVGPWNENDNWWDPPSNWSRPRRKFKDLQQGTPEAFAAVAWGYNDSLDEFGRIVTTRPDGPGIDVSTEAAAWLGWGNLENRWVYIQSFNWDFPN